MCCAMCGSMDWAQLTPCPLGIILRSWKRQTIHNAATLTGSKTWSRQQRAQWRLSDLFARISFAVPILTFRIGLHR